MIKVSIEYQNQEIRALTVQGHAESAPFGQDLVCAGVTAIMNGAFNALNHLASKEIDLVVQDNLLKVEVKSPTQQVKQLLIMLQIQLATISQQYPQNIVIREVY